MKLSRKDWNNYVARLSAINKTAGRKMQAWINKHGIDDVEALVEVAYALATKYGEASSAVACQMYDEMAEIQKANVPPAVPKAPQHINYVNQAIRSTLDRAPSMVPSTVSELVKRTGAETTLKNAKRDGAYFAWVPNGDTCAFCMTLASNGWRKASKKTISGNHKEHIHANCDCEFAISFNGPGQIEGYDPDKYLEMYEGAEGNNWKEKVNSMRRAQYAANKDMINAQKRAAYAARKTRETIANTSENDIINEERYREGNPVEPTKKTLEMALNKEQYAYAIAEKFSINLKGSGKKISIRIDESIPQPGKVRKAEPDVIILGPSAFASEEELANTIAHELNHSRSYLKGGDAPEIDAYESGDALAEFIRGER